MKISKWSVIFVETPWSKLKVLVTVISILHNIIHNNRICNRNSYPENQIFIVLLNCMERETPYAVNWGRLTGTSYQFAHSVVLKVLTMESSMDYANKSKNKVYIKHIWFVSCIAQNNYARINEHYGIHLLRFTSN